MLVTVKLFASLSRFSPGGLAGTPFELDLPASATVQTVLDLLGIPQAESRVAFINGLIKDVDCVLAPGDELGIFPPIGGG